MSITGKHYEQFAPHERFTLTLQALARGDETEADRLTDACPRRQYSQLDVGFTERMDTALHILAISCIDLRCLWGKLQTLEWAIGGARLMATHHHITATFALMEGQRLGQGLPQMDFFSGRREQPDDGAGDDETPDAEDEQVGDGGDADADADEPARAPDAPRYSDYHDGDLATRMAGVEDRMQVMTDHTFASLLAAAHQIAGDLAEVWTAFDRFCHSRLGLSAEALLEAWEFPTGREVTEMLKRYPHVTPDPAKVDVYFGLYCGAWDRRFGAED